MYSWMALGFYISVDCSPIFHLSFFHSYSDMYPNPRMSVDSDSLRQMVS